MMSTHSVSTLVAAGLLVLMGTGCRSTTPTVDAAAEAAAVRAVLDEQVAAWNEGAIDRFMEGYWQSDSLRFASGGSVRRGWQTTLDRYRTSYPDRQAMGRLAFEDLEIRILSPSWAAVYGRFRLYRDASLGELTGPFTLLLEKRPEGWRIVSDHTSTD